jgi:outer membrane lipoprotein-sorting protein
MDYRLKIRLGNFRTVIMIRLWHMHFLSFLFLLFLFWPADLITGALAGETAEQPMDQSARKAFLERLRKVQATIRTFQADFREERKMSSLGRPLSFEGRVYYARESLFFMAYQRPFPYILQVRGKEALLYVEGSGTADVMDISGVEGLGKRPDLLGWDPNQFKGEVWEETGGYRMEETGRKDGDDENSRRLVVFIDHQTLLASRIQMDDASGDVTKITLSNVKVNQELPSKVLHYALPEGTKLNRLSQP